MTKQELNRDVKRLARQLVKLRDDVRYTKKQDDDWYDFLEIYGKVEFLRLYCADTSLEMLTASNIRRMIRMNQIFQAVPYHQFGWSITLNEIK